MPLKIMTCSFYNAMQSVGMIHSVIIHVDSVARKTHLAQWLSCGLDVWWIVVRCPAGQFLVFSRKWRQLWGSHSFLPNGRVWHFPRLKNETDRSKEWMALHLHFPIHFHFTFNLGGPLRLSTVLCVCWWRNVVLFCCFLKTSDFYIRC
jgi:hypothetical protein